MNKTNKLESLTWINKNLCFKMMYKLYNANNTCLNNKKIIQPLMNNLIYKQDLHII